MTFRVAHNTFQIIIMAFENILKRIVRESDYSPTAGLFVM